MILSISINISIKVTFAVRNFFVSYTSGIALFTIRLSTYCQAFEVIFRTAVHS